MRTGRSILDRGWLMLAAGVAVALVFSVLWLSRATVPFDNDPVPVAEGETGSTPGGDFTLRGMTTIDVIPDYSRAKSPLPGAVWVAVMFDYAGEPGSQVYCNVTLLGDDRKWILDEPSSVADWGYQSFCDGSSGTVLKFFEVPATAVEEIHGIQIWGNGGTVVLAGEVKPQ